MLLLTIVAVPFPALAAESPAPAFSTFTVMAVDREAGQIGVATASGYPFDVLSRVMFASSGGHGEPAHIVVSQAMGNPQHWNLGRRLTDGATVEEALAELLAEDEQAEFRQVAVCAAGSPPVAHTGAECGEFAGHRIDAERGLLVMGNALDGPHVLEAMMAALRESEESLPERLVAALEAGEAAGGEVRPLLSAGYCTVRLQPSGNRGADKPVIVTVARDAQAPLAELRKHIAQRRAVQLLEEGIGLCSQGGFDAGLAALETSVELDPHSPEGFLWLGYYRFQQSDGLRGRASVAQAEARYAKRLGSREAGAATVRAILQKWGDPQLVSRLLPTARSPALAE